MSRMIAIGIGVLLTLAPAPPSRAQDHASRPASESRVPNFLGVTGLLLTPSASLQRDAQLSPHFVGGADLVGGGVVVGFRHRLELGLAFLNPDSRFVPGDRAFLLNAKLNVLPETLLRPALSVGVTDALDEFEKDPSWYVVLSKQVVAYFMEALTGRDVAITLHLGFGGGVHEERVFAGTELFLSPAFSALAEIHHGEFNFGARFRHRGLRATLGLIDLGRLNGSLSYVVTFR